MRRGASQSLSVIPKRTSAVDRAKRGSRQKIEDEVAPIESSGVHGLGKTVIVHYLVLYPVTQLIVFTWRTDYETPAILWGLKQAQLTSIAVLLIVVPVFVTAWSRSKRSAGTRLAKAGS